MSEIRGIKSSIARIFFFFKRTGKTCLTPSYFKAIQLARFLHYAQDTVCNDHTFSTLQWQFYMPYLTSSCIWQAVQNEVIGQLKNVIFKYFRNVYSQHKHLCASTILQAGWASNNIAQVNGPDMVWSYTNFVRGPQGTCMTSGFMKKKRQPTECPTYMRSSGQIVWDLVSPLIPSGIPPLFGQFLH